MTSLLINFFMILDTILYISVDVVEAVMDKASVGKAFKKNAKTVYDAVAKMNGNELEELEKAINSNG